MATGHILPGYGNPVTRLRRAQTAYPLDKQKLQELTAQNVPDLDRRTLDQIRANARNMWLRPKYQPTTYGTFYSGDQLDEPTETRATEPLRRHKPHPKPVFLINRLHYVPGYHNADATMGKEVYRVDDTFSEEERQLRRHQREKYVARPRTAAVDQYREPWAQLTEAVGPVEAWGAQAWLKTADDDHQHEVVNAIRDYKDKELFNVPKSIQCASTNQNTAPEPAKDTANQVPAVDAVKELDNQNEHPNEAVKVDSGKIRGHGFVDTVTLDKHEIDGHKKLRDIAVKFSATKRELELQKLKAKPSNNGTRLNSRNKAFSLRCMTPGGSKNDSIDIEGIMRRLNGNYKSPRDKNENYIAVYQGVQGANSANGGGKQYLLFKQGMPERKAEREGRKTICTVKQVECKTNGKVQSPVPPQMFDASPRPHTAVPSMHRWMKTAGAKESEQVRTILYGGYPPSTIQPLGSFGNPKTTYLRRKEDVDNVRKAKYINKYPRGDFLIHPEYPPTFPHHKID